MIEEAVVVAPKGRGPMEQMLALLAEDGEAEATTLTLGMIAENAGWIRAREPKLAEGAEVVRKAWIGKVKEHWGAEDAEEFDGRWETAFVRARMAEPKPKAPSESEREARLGDWLAERKVKDDTLTPAPEVPEPGDANPPLLSKNRPLISAKAFAKAKLYREGMLATRYYGDNWWQWNGRFYEPVSDNGMETRVSNFLEAASIWGGDGRECFNPKTKDINEVLAATRRHCLYEEVPPRWFARAEEAEQWLVFKNCLVDYETGEMRKLTPELWAHGGVDFDYHPDAECRRWERFLRETFPNDLEAADCIEEQLGYGMTWDARFHKAALWIGKPRSGKSTVEWTQRQLTGPSLCASLDFSDWISGPNARTNMIGKKIGIFPDVRLKPAKAYGRTGYDPGGLDHRSVSLLVQITGQGSVEIGTKYEKLPWEGIPKIKFEIVSNDPLRMHDPGGALLGRLVKVGFGQSRPEDDQDLDLWEKGLRPELPGIAARCLRAYQRLRARKKFIQPKSAGGLEADLQEKANGYLKFMRETFTLDPSARVGIDLFWSKFAGWRENNGRPDLGVTNAQQLVIEIKKIGEPYDKLLEKSHRVNSDPRFYAGIKLRPE
jgi:putative DNA primase/helicase